MNLDQFKTVEQLAAAIKTMDMVTSVPWTDYSPAGTGWSATTEEEIFYKKIGKLVFVHFRISGTSDAITTNFNLPYTRVTAGGGQVNPCVTQDNGTLDAGYVALTTTVANFYYTPATAIDGWTNSGTKSIYGQFWYEAA